MPTQVNGPKSAFVTGGTGFLGRHLVEQLQQSGCQVTALHRTNADVTWLAASGATLVEGNMTDSDRMASCMPEQVDAVFHVAGDTSLWRENADRVFETNVSATKALLSAARKVGAKRFLHTSTVGVYGTTFDTLREDAKHLGRVSPIPYLYTKAMAEEAVQEAIMSGQDAVILNPASIVGQYDAHNWARLFRMLHEERLPGVPPGSGSFCHAADVAHAHIAAYERGRTGHNYILGGTNASYLEFLQAAAEILGKPKPKTATSAWLLAMMGQLAQLGSYFTQREPEITPDGAKLISAQQSVDSTKAAEELGYRSAAMETAIADCISWLKSEGHLV